MEWEEGVCRREEEAEENEERGGGVELGEQ